ncbi:uncharacterized protein B0H64DRAFT_411105 [Chaetomium fimeti]|uniref:ribonuclease H n=1 Tax=Chaetomium fimeti TaxID=1854472 RepID=A0AAE0H6S3_9PEZI|nr:hypothetical protein B0H64DRAFT_411105 [Chaetomium fimeti]
MSWLDFGLTSKRCAVCPSTSGLLRCGGCKVVSYCNPKHQSTHRSKHKVACTTIKDTREKLEREEAALRDAAGSNFIPADVFNSSVGRFWGILGTRDYMRARFNAADALLKVGTVAAVEKALDHLTDMLRLCRSDNMGVRDIIPSVLLRLGREQECYDFLKWWATVDHETYDWGNMDLPYLDTKGANVFEAVDPSLGGLSHLVALTLLKLRLLLDFQAYESEFGFGVGGFAEPDRPVGDLVKSKIRTFSPREISSTIKALKGQYHELCQRVNKANPYFWDALLDEGAGAPTIPEYYTHGSPEEAQFVLYHCKRAWEESEEAVGMADADTYKFVQAYKGAEERQGDLEIKRGRGLMFPFQFEHDVPTSSPPACFPATMISGGQSVRFISSHDPQTVLLYVDGACTNNGQPNPRGGWAVVYGPTDSASGRLEDKGPFGDDSVATSNRAELRATIAALRVRDWKQEGFSTIVIATDSSYVVDGATSWTRGWMLNGWMTQSGAPVKNKDLWELLLGEVEKLDRRGCRVDLWKVPRERNVEADALAKAAANRERGEPEFRDPVIRAFKSTTKPTGGRAETKPSILTLCLDYEDMFHDIFGGLVAKLASKATMERATKAEAALSMLSKQPPPSVVLVTDGAVTRHQKLCERLIDLLRGGTTVILGGCFSGMVSLGQFNRFFTRIGLPWRRGSYFRETVQLRRNVVGDRLASKLPSAYSQKALYVDNVDKSTMWYVEKENSTEAAVVFANVGAGKLGYVGDVNGEKGSEAVVLAMCGFLE